MHAALAGALLVASVVLVGACGGRDEPEREPQLMRLAVKTSPGGIEAGDRCCFGPGDRDIGGTRTISTGCTRAVVDLKPGTYTYLRSAGGHWRTQHGTLVVR